MYGQFIRSMPEGTDKEKPWLWMRKCDLEIPTAAPDIFCKRTNSKNKLCQIPH